MIDSVAKGFDRLAPVYDNLARLVLGKSINKSQIQFINFVEGKKKLLVLGGGTGWILPLILERNPGLKIDYIDISSGMISLAREKVNSNTRVRFITGTEDDIPDTDYDCLITNFYLDLFSEERLPGLVSHLKKHLLRNSHWIATDFVNEKIWHKIVLWIMYRFFRLIAEVRTLRLADWREQLVKQGTVIASQDFARGFIRAVVIRF